MYIYIYKPPISKKKQSCVYRLAFTIVKDTRIVTFIDTLQSEKLGSAVAG